MTDTSTYESSAIVSWFLYVFFSAVAASLFVAARLPLQSTLPTYLVAGCFLSAASLLILVQRGWKNVFPQTWDVLVFLLLACWGYGVTQGKLHANPTKLVFRNYAGMVLYASYFALRLLHVKKRELAKAVIVASSLAALLCFVLLYREYGRAIFVQLFKGRILYAEIQNLAFVGAPFFLSYFLPENETTISRAYFFGAACVLVFTLAMTLLAGLAKGMIAYFVLLVMLFLIRALRGVRVKPAWLIALFSLLLILVFALDLLGFSSKYLEKINGGKGERFLQCRYLLEDFYIPGNGLGATLSNGFRRGGALAYAYEATPFNLLHKLGVFALIPFFAFGLATFDSIGKIFSAARLETEHLVALGILNFLIMGVGNPSLYSPTSVLMQSVLFFLLRPEGKAPREP